MRPSQGTPTAIGQIKAMGRPIKNHVTKADRVARDLSAKGAESMGLPKSTAMARGINHG